VSRDFKGSVFVEFKTPQAMETALGADIEYEGAPLRLEKKQDYLIRKIKERKAKGKGQVGAREGPTWCIWVVE
jgi:lupus La protein